MTRPRKPPGGMRELESALDIASRVRQRLLNKYGSLCSMCQEASEALAKELTHSGYQQVKIINGRFSRDPHYWVEIGGATLVDITLRDNIEEDGVFGGSYPADYYDYIIIGSPPEKLLI